MAQPKRLVCFVEGKGDQTAIPILARRVLKRINATSHLVVDSDERGPYNAHGIGKLVKTESGKSLPNWQRWLEAAARERQPLGGVLLVLDGDDKHPLKHWASYYERHKTDKFCARDAARTLAHDARMVRGGEAFSVAVIFVMKEFEPGYWLAWKVCGKSLSDGKSKVPNNAACRTIKDLEAVRDAKGELKAIIPGYEESLDQGLLAKEVRLYPVLRRCPSFRRFWRAVRELANAANTNRPVATPAFPP